MLSAKELIEHREKPAVEIPSLGIKDFEPDLSPEQSEKVQNSVVEIKNVVSQERVKMRNSLSQAVWHAELHLAEVTHRTGSCWTYMGHKIGDKLYIFPEEALYLLEIGCLQIMHNGVSLSVQRAYCILFSGESHITVEKYRAYSLLSSYGYKVLRHSPQNTVTKYEKQLEVHRLGLKLKQHHSSKKTGKRQEDFVDNPFERNKKAKIDALETFPVIYKEDVNSMDVLEKAQIVQPYAIDSKTDLNFDYDVYLESSEKVFKKSCLQLPDFRVIVHRGEDSTPDVEEFCKTSGQFKDEVPVIHAVVFFDCLTFYKIDPVIVPNICD